MTPIELRLRRIRTVAGLPMYMVSTVWPGPGNVTPGPKFAKAVDARQWAKAKWPKVPLLRDA